jgi:hypothetical protein
MIGKSSFACATIAEEYDGASSMDSEFSKGSYGASRGTGLISWGDKARRRYGDARFRRGSPKGIWLPPSGWSDLARGFWSSAR